MNARTVRRHMNRARRILASRMFMAEMNAALVDSIHSLNHLSTAAWELGLDDELTAVLDECRRRVASNAEILATKFMPVNTVALLDAADRAVLAA